MAKRFSDTNKWDDVWFSELKNDYKVIWIYLLDKCDHAGIIKLNLKNLNHACSTRISVEEFSQIFGDRLIQISNEEWIIEKFCRFHYGDNILSSKSASAKSAVKILTDKKIIEIDSKGSIRVNIPLPNPMVTLNQPLPNPTKPLTTTTTTITTSSSTSITPTISMTPTISPLSTVTATMTTEQLQEHIKNIQDYIYDSLSENEQRQLLQAIDKNFTTERGKELIIGLLKKEFFTRKMFNELLDDYDSEIRSIEILRKAFQYEHTAATGQVD